MKWLKRLSLALLALLMLAMLVVYLTPLDTYVPEVEQTLSGQLHEPVDIQHIRIVLMPLPHIELQGVSLGGPQGIAVQSVEVEPDMFSLLADKVVVRRIVVKAGVAHLAEVRKLAELLANTPVALQRVAVRELQFSGVNLIMPEMSLGPMEGKLTFMPAGQLESVWLAMDEQKLTAILLPQPDRHFALQLQARDWIPPSLPGFPQMLIDDLQVEGVLGERDLVAQKFAITLHGIHANGSAQVGFADGWQVQATLAHVDARLEQLMVLQGEPAELTGALSAKGGVSSKAGALGALKDNLLFSGDVLVKQATARIADGFQHPLVFDQIKARVTARPERLDVGGLEATLYGGKLTGTASINRKNTMLVADVAVSEIAMQPLVEALSNEVLFTGSMESAAKISMRLDAFDRFPQNLQLAGSFHLRNGVLSKVDLVQAASRKTNVSGGTTRFDDLTGLLNVDASGYHFRRLKISSGSLNAEGKLDINPALQLNGTLDTNVKGTIGLVSMPMVVSGTLSNPVVVPSGSAWAGAAVGTVILGPGIGTAIGIKIGGFLNKLFGKNDEKNNDKQGAHGTPLKK